MSYAKAKHVSVSEIPVIDIGNLLDGGPSDYEAIAERILHAATSTGFFYVENHGIAQSLIDDVLALSRQFFSLDDDLKQAVAVTDRHRGYLEIGEAKMEGSGTIDLKESYIWGREFTPAALADLADNPLIGANRWPAEIPEMKTTFNDYFEQCVDLGKLLLRVFAVSLGVDLGYFSGQFAYTITRASTLYYPPQPGSMGEKQFGVAPHTDYGTLTLLHQDDTGGLQVYGNDGWVTAHPIAGTFVVNVGDLLSRWTNGVFASTPHRVINSSDHARQSLAVFVDPDYDSMIIPVVAEGDSPKFSPISCGEHIQKRFDNSFDYRNQADPK